MRKLTAYIGMIVIVFLMGFFAGKWYNRPKLDMQHITFAIVDAIDHCYREVAKDPELGTCDDLHGLFSDVLAADSKKAETAARIEGYLNRADQTMPAEAKEKILELLQ
jgi:hypothetical protein